MKTTLLAEDHTLVRTGIRTMLEISAKLRVVGEANDGREAVRLYGELKPDLVVMDVSMPVLNGIEAARQIVAANPEARVIMLSMHGEAQYVLESLRAGAVGYVRKDAAFAEMLEAIKTVAEGRTYLSPTLSELVTANYIRLARGEGTPNELAKLSGREREVLQLLSEGYSSAKIAAMLHISIRTVDTHRQNIMDKLDVHSVAGLTKLAIRHGLSTA